MDRPTPHQREANPYPSSSRSTSTRLSRSGDLLDLILLKATGAALAIPQSVNALVNGADVNEFTVGLGAAMVGGREFRCFVLSLIRAWRGT